METRQGLCFITSDKTFTDLGSLLDWQTEGWSALELRVIEAHLITAQETIQRVLKGRSDGS